MRPGFWLFSVPRLLTPKEFSFPNLYKAAAAASCPLCTHASGTLGSLLCAWLRSSSPNLSVDGFPGGGCPWCTALDTQRDPCTLLNIAGQEHKQLIKTAAGTSCAHDLESSVCSRNRKKWEQLCKLGMLVVGERRLWGPLCAEEPPASRNRLLLGLGADG